MVPPLRHVLSVVNQFDRAPVAGIRRCVAGVLYLHRSRLSYHHVVEVSQFAGILNLAAGRNDVVIFSGQYIHCGQSMQETASGGIRLDILTAGEDESGETTGVYVDIRVLECPCGFRLMLPGWKQRLWAPEARSRSSAAPPS